MMVKSHINPWRRFLKLLQLEKKDLYAIYFYAIAGGILSLSLPLGIQSVIRFIQSGQITTSWAVLIVLVVTGAILGGIMQIMQLRITENIQQRLFVHYAFDFAHRFPRFKRNTLNNENPNELINRFFDIIGLQKGFSKVLLDFPSAVLQIIFSLLVLSLYHPFYIAFSVFLVALLALLFKPFIRYGLETSLNESKHKYSTAFWLQEITRSSWSFRTSADEQLSLNRLDESATNYIKSREEHFQLLTKQFIWVIAFKVLIIISLLALGGYLVISQQLNLGQFVAAEVLILLLIGAVEKVIRSMDNLYDVCTSLEKLEQVRDIPLLFEECDPDRDIEFFPIELIQKHPENRGEPIVSLTRGERITITGNNRHTSESLLKQFIENTNDCYWSVRWNYSVPSGGDLAAAYAEIGWFSSESQIIEGTLLDNIVLQRPSITKDDAVHVMNLLQIDHLFMNSLEGLHTQMKTLQEIITPEESERLLISRAIIHKPKLLLLSFWDAAMSVENQKSVLKKIADFLPETTVVYTSGVPVMEKWKVLNLNDLQT